ncbi:MAG: hypothetical protein SGARI_005933, partial [Bacillariaceae sp.]
MSSPNPASPSKSEESSPPEESLKYRKPWPPASDEIFLIEDFDIPKSVDVDLRKIEFLSRDDPAFFIHYASDAEIHASLAVAGSPVPQGASAAASGVAFRQFVQNFFVQISPNCRVPSQPVPPAVVGVSPVPAVYSTCAFQRLSNHEAGNVLNMSMQYIIWVAAVLATPGARTGTVFEMTPSPGGAAGGGRSPQCQPIRRPIFL